MAPGRLASPAPEGSASQPAIKPQHTGNLKPAADNIYGNYHPADPKTLNLESNFGPMDPENVGYLQPTSFDTPLEIMHERFQRDGYLFVGHTVQLYSRGQS
jgi:phytanoyl-CoA hydroxylase